MNATNIYLTFDGSCREAMTFYGKCLQGEPNFTAFSSGPPEVAAMAKSTPDRILHAELKSGPVVLMASDTMPGMPFRVAIISIFRSPATAWRRWNGFSLRSAKKAPSPWPCTTPSGEGVLAC